MVKVFLFKEQVYSIEEELLPSFRKLCEQVGYRTQYNRNTLSLYLKPWLDGKKIVIHWQRNNREEPIDGFPSQLESLLMPYGAEVVLMDKWTFTSPVEQLGKYIQKSPGDLYLFLYGTKDKQIELLYTSSSGEHGKNLAHSIFASFLTMDEVNVMKPIFLWNPFSQDKYRKILSKIEKPALLMKVPADSSSDTLTQGILEGILNFFQVPIFLPQNDSPDIWEKIIVQVLEIKRSQLPKPEEDSLSVAIEAVANKEPIVEEEEPVSADALEEPIIEEPIIEEIPEEPIQVPEPEPIVEKLEPVATLSFVPGATPPPASIPAARIPAPTLQERIKALQNQQNLLNLKNQHKKSLDNPYESLTAHPAWNQSPFMKNSSGKSQNGPTINPFEKSKTNQNSAKSTKTINPFEKRR